MFRVHMSRITLFILILSAILMLTACGDGGDESATIPMPEPPIQPTPEPEPTGPVTFNKMGTARVTGITSYSVTSIGGRFPGTFSGMRDYYSFDDWGFWLNQGDTTLFKIFIRDTDDPFGSDYELVTQGIPTGSNPVSGSVVWSGGVRAYDVHPDTFGTPVSGDARLEVDLSTATINVDFTNFTKDHADLAWRNLSLSNGKFQSRNGYRTINGAFYGHDHEGAAGKFTSFRLDGVFGTLRE